MTVFARLDDKCKDAGVELRLMTVGEDDLELRVWSPKMKKYLGKVKFDPAKPDDAAEKLANQLTLGQGI